MRSNILRAMDIMHKSSEYVRHTINSGKEMSDRALIDETKKLATHYMNHLIGGIDYAKEKINA